MSQEIELYQKIQDPIDAITRLGTHFSRSGLFGCENVEQGMVLAWECLASRKSPLEIMRRHHLYDGKLSLIATAMLADFRADGGKHKIISRTSDKAEIELIKDGETERFSFTWTEAQAEPFVKSTKTKSGFKTNWETPRARTQMLWARVVSDGVRAMAPEIVVGVYTPEELDDLPRKNVEPLLKPKTEKQAATTEAAKEKPIEVEVVSQAESATADSTPEAPKLVIAAIDPRTGKLNLETLLALSNIMPDETAKMGLAWCMARHWLNEGQAFEDLLPQRAQKILNNPTDFLKTIRA